MVYHICALLNVPRILIPIMEVQGILLTFILTGCHGRGSILNKEIRPASFPDKVETKEHVSRHLNLSTLRHNSNYYEQFLKGSTLLEDLLCKDHIAFCEIITQSNNLCKRSDLVFAKCHQTCTGCDPACYDQGFHCDVILTYDACSDKFKKKCQKTCGYCGTKSRDYCLTDDTDPYVLYASKTPYVFARGENLTSKDLVPEGCSAQSVWLLSRHGTRYPGDGDIGRFLRRLPILQNLTIEAYQNGKGFLCDGDIEALRKWQLGGINLTYEALLTPEGVRELESLATSYKEYLPILLNQQFDNDTYKFRHTDKQRTERSARSFAKGMFGEVEGESIYMPKPIKNDPLLMFYKNCDRYEKEVEDNDDALIEFDLFYEGKEMHDVAASVTRRLGHYVSIADVDVIYDACRYYKAFDPTLTSAWCAALTSEDLKVLEYWQDIKYYYENGYGYNINYQMACPLVKDLIQHFRSIQAQNGDKTKGVFYFTHSDALLEFTSRLGLYNDTSPLLHNNLDPGRLWRSSLHGPFANNFAFTLSSCQNGEWWVSIIQNEIATAIPGCSGGSAGCSWEEFLQVLAPYEDCPFEEICKD